MKEVEPALTPDEWKRGVVDRTSDPYTGQSAYLNPYKRTFGSDGYGAVNGCGDEMGVDFPVEDRHAIAALALHGQPFGFAPDDVRHLRALRTWAGAADTLAFLDNLADRIAALLPPEEAK